MASLYKWILILLSLFLFLTGLGKQLFLVKIAGVIITGLVLVILKLEKKKLKLPENFKLWLTFLFILSLSFFWTKNAAAGLEDWLLLLAGTGFWLVGFNLKSEFQKRFKLILISLGLIYGGIWIYYQYWVKEVPIIAYSLSTHYSAFKNHLILGDYWSGVMAILLVMLTKNSKKIWLWLLTGLGMYFIVISQSRAALVALLAGIGYLATQNKLKNNKTLKLIGFGLVTIFFFFALSKSTLLVRDYYIQTLVSLKDHVFGVGLGNFRIISGNPAYHLWGRNDYSYNAHSLVFEMISAVGLFGLVFAYWLYQVSKRVWLLKTKKNLEYQVAFIVLTVNMLLFSSYLSPTIIWTWFLLLGLC